MVEKNSLTALVITRLIDKNFVTLSVNFDSFPSNRLRTTSFLLFQTHLSYPYLPPEEGAERNVKQVFW
jgi:hypothetical protein